MYLPKHSVDAKHFQFNTVRISNSKNFNTQVYTALFKFWSLLIHNICRTTPMYLKMNWGTKIKGPRFDPELKLRMLQLGENPCRCIHCPPLTVQGNKTTSGRSPFSKRQAHYGGIDSLCDVDFLLQIWPWVPLYLITHWYP